jgi:DnaJ-domain-containing protein 1
MTDYFALFGEDRRPWLDENSLRAKFLELSAQFHPDRVHSKSEAEKKEANDRYLELNTAYNLLREPKGRLRHLLELEIGKRPSEVQEISPEAAEMFMEISELCREVDRFLGERLKATSPILRVGLFSLAQDFIEKLNDQQRAVRKKMDSLEEELKQLNAYWETNGPSSFAQLERLYRDASYLARWTSQLQERVTQLAF